MEHYRNIQLSPELEEAAAKVQQEVTAAFEEAERELELMRQEGEAEEMAADCPRINSLKVPLVRLMIQSITVPTRDRN